MILPTTEQLVDMVLAHEQCTGSFPESIVASQQTINRMVDSRGGDRGGFTSLRIMGVDVLPNEHAPHGHFYTRDYVE